MKKGNEERKKREESDEGIGNRFKRSENKKLNAIT